ncbi:MAG: SUMF1/EgtB/PvdO family nonheme iron enzyme [Saprospiraceae bacterium]
MRKGFQFKEILDNQNNRKNHLLAIAINDYVFCPKLNNAVKDAQDFINLMLDKFEFEEANITFLKDTEATKTNIIKQLRQLIRSLSANDNLVIYFSGHGEFDDIEDEGYWLTQEVRQGAYANYLPNTRIKKLISKINAHHIFLISDACFSGALFGKNTRQAHEVYERDASRWGLTSGRNEIVTDRKPGENSPFAKSLLTALRNTSEPLPILTLGQKVQDNTTINANQSPRYEPIDKSGHFGGQFVFRLKNNIEAAWQQTLGINTIEAFLAFETQYPDSKFEQEIDAKIREVEDEEEWQIAKDTNKVSRYRRYKKSFPKGKYVKLANQAIANLVKVKSTKLIIQTPKIIIDNDPFANQMVKVEGGSFMMGSNDYESEQPIHEVTVPTFHISKYQVTQKQWQEIMDNNPSHFKGENRPVECVSWNDTQEFIKKINQKTDKKYRLPIEAEWEFAARGGNKSQNYKYAGSNNLNEVAWYNKNSRNLGKEHRNYGTNPVGTKKPNELGIYDMNGNVWERCEDKWHNNYKNAPNDGFAWLRAGVENRYVTRGGSWINKNYFTVTYRAWEYSHSQEFYIGFRVVRDN